MMTSDPNRTWYRWYKKKGKTFSTCIRLQIIHFLSKESWRNKAVINMSIQNPRWCFHFHFQFNSFAAFCCFLLLQFEKLQSTKQKLSSFCDGFFFYGIFFSKLCSQTLWSFVFWNNGHHPLTLSSTFQQQTFIKVIEGIKDVQMVFFVVVLL